MNVGEITKQASSILDLAHEGNGKKNAKIIPLKTEMKENKEMRHKIDGVRKEKERLTNPQVSTVSPNFSSQTKRR